MFSPPVDKFIFLARRKMFSPTLEKFICLVQKNLFATGGKKFRNGRQMSSLSETKNFAAKEKFVK